MSSNHNGNQPKPLFKYPVVDEGAHPWISMLNNFLTSAVTYGKSVDGVFLIDNEGKLYLTVLQPVDGEELFLSTPSQSSNGTEPTTQTHTTNPTGPDTTITNCFQFPVMKVCVDDMYLYAHGPFYKRERSKSLSRWINLLIHALHLAFQHQNVQPPPVESVSSLSYILVLPAPKVAHTDGSIHQLFPIFTFSADFSEDKLFCYFSILRSDFDRPQTSQPDPATAKPSKIGVINGPTLQAMEGKILEYLNDQAGFGVIANFISDVLKLTRNKLRKEGWGPADFSEIYN